MYSLILVFSTLFADDIQLENVRQLSLSREYDEAGAKLRLINKNKVRDIGKYHFYKALIAYKQMDKKTLEKEAEFFEDSIIPLPKRYVDVVYIMNEDAKLWKDSPLLNIDRKMKMASERLETAKAGPQTQKLQKEILEDLDKLIKQKEDDLAAAKAAANAKEKAQGKERAEAQDISPAQDSHLPGGEAAGKVDMKKFKEYADTWGKLPPKERAKAMVDLTRGMPPKYKQAIEEYFKRIEHKK